MHRFKTAEKSFESDLIREWFESKFCVIMAPTGESFSARFEAEVLKYVKQKGCSNSAAARHFEIDEENIRKWKLSDTLFVQ